MLTRRAVSKLKDRFVSRRRERWQSTGPVVRTGRGRSGREGAASIGKRASCRAMRVPALTAARFSGQLRRKTAQNAESARKPRCATHRDS
jgi:hypothetical protein